MSKKDDKKTAKLEPSVKFEIPKDFDIPKEDQDKILENLRFLVENGPPSDFEFPDDIPDDLMLPPADDFPLLSEAEDDFERKEIFAAMLTSAISFATFEMPAEDIPVCDADGEYNFRINLDIKYSEKERKAYGLIFDVVDHNKENGDNSN